VEATFVPSYYTVNTFQANDNYIDYASRDALSQTNARAFRLYQLANASLEHLQDAGDPSGCSNYLDTRVPPGLQHRAGRALRPSGRLGKQAFKSPLAPDGLG